MPRFALLYHETPSGADKPPHWDLMLEAGEILRTWTLQQFPQFDRPNEAFADFDHRRAYLDYEGPVSRGRGSVRREDGGQFQWVEDAPDRVVVILKGERLQGKLVLEVHSS